MLANAMALHGELDEGQARHRLERLATLTHLRHEFHPTMRDLRSSLAYLVTGNLSCEQVHRARFEPWHMICSVSDSIGA